jgi:hypothetical protein
MVPSPVCVAAKQDVNQTRLGRKGSTRKSQNPALKSGNVSASLKPPTALHDSQLITKTVARDDQSRETLTQDRLSLIEDL